MRRKYVLREAKQTGRPPEIRVYAYNTEEDFERASVGVVEARGRYGRTRRHVGGRTYPVSEGEGEFFFGDGEGENGEVVPVATDDVMLIPKDAVYGYRGQMRLFLVHTPACEQDPGVHL